MIKEVKASKGRKRESKAYKYHLLDKRKPSLTFQLSLLRCIDLKKRQDFDLRSLMTKINAELSKGFQEKAST